MPKSDNLHTPARFCSENMSDCSFLPSLSLHLPKRKVSTQRAFQMKFPWISGHPFPNCGFVQLNTSATKPLSIHMRAWDGVGPGGECIAKERGTNNLVILGQPFFHQTTLFFCE